ncbi:hypothetical protein B0181_08900 [Moraxella caviae]|uniref:Membrane-bound lysozyme-inhibitor of c-type lysozyme n=1 Tax=Moraxella caviae TaxID=34060 RepID=A0A1S9ZX16_9GAMM|nr:MliC family protein [Moraxella caviae]OOR88062.1 hypothetical protein B0181_08900 [Moraxella caviae]STZ10000.1 Membrane-bound lysozyme-inhibitor of c-type lysozyme [Moraxella caviae]VEW12949.1 Membrane-bound lysozyme-inhibitor of c-type lysozyme [Moraxella caviae]
MKKLLLTGSVLAAVLATGCATGHYAAHAHQDSKSQMRHDSKKGGKHTHHKHDKLTQTYRCENGAVVHAHYQPKTNNAKFAISAPSWQLDNAQITMNADVTGSGMRFVNDSNPAAKYEWHTKGADGILSVSTADGKQHSLQCSSANLAQHKKPAKHKQSEKHEMRKQGKNLPQPIAPQSAQPAANPQP